MWVWVPRHTTPLTHTMFLLLFVYAVGGCLVRASTLPPPLIMLAVSSRLAESSLLFFSRAQSQHKAKRKKPICCIRSTTILFVFLSLQNTKQIFFFLSLWIDLWLAVSEVLPGTATDNHMYTYTLTHLILNIDTCADTLLY